MTTHLRDSSSRTMLTLRVHCEPLALKMRVHSVFHVIV